MPLVSKLFTTPQIDPRLEGCLVDDAKHITQGSTGNHVRKIQIALNSLSNGAGRENFNLKVDGIYGPRTAAAVKKYKDAPPRRQRFQLLQPFQTSADNIVGKHTINALDVEMDVFENESPGTSALVASDPSGAPPRSQLDHYYTRDDIQSDFRP